MELGAARLSAITLTKLRKTRAEVDKQLLEEATREAREEEEEAKAAAKRKADQEKLGKLSEKEQERVSGMCAEASAQRDRLTLLQLLHSARRSSVSVCSASRPERLARSAKLSTPYNEITRAQICSD